LNRAVFVAAASLVALAVPGIGVRADPVDSSAFAPLGEPLLVTRTVVRTLHDGKEIVARRSYLVSFAPDGDAFTVNGRLVASEITAPPALQAIAELERARPDSGTFPIALDRSGLARAGSVPASPSSANADAARAARALVAGADVAIADKREADAFIAEAAARGSAIPWPAELFSPAAADRHDRRSVALANDENGTVEVTHRITARLPNGAPAGFIREVVTEIGATRRVSREEWTILPRPTH